VAGNLSPMIDASNDQTPCSKLASERNRTAPKVRNFFTCMGEQTLRIPEKS
jgi:hypothetical protein